MIQMIDQSAPTMLEAKPENITCQGCAELRLELFQSKQSSREHSTTFAHILDGSSKGCCSCLVIKGALAVLAPDLSPESAMRLVSPIVAGLRPALKIAWGAGHHPGMRTSIQLYSLPDQPVPWNAIGGDDCRNVDHDSSSRACLSLACSWLKSCVDTHEGCDSGTHPLPKRVVHVGSEDVNPRLYISRGERARYIALSHVWGGFRPLATEKATLAQRLGGISLSDMHKTFRDAVTLARFLGVAYLWIDSLCIVQDDPLDWQTQAATMATIYSNALLTIAADDAKDSRHGFLRPRDEEAYTSVEIPYATGEAKSETSHVYARKQRLAIGALGDNHAVGPRTIEEFAHTGELGHHRSLLDTRAWAFQERLLSPRTLHYTSSEMAFECRESIRCECSPGLTTQKELLFKNQGGTHSSENTFDWMSVVESFTRRNLTFDTDRLPALAGVAAAMQLQTAGDYVCGLWKHEFRTNLLWQVSSSSSSRDERTYRHARFYAPSWSWASVNGPVLYHFGLRNGWAEDEGEWAEVLSVDVEKTTANPYGPARGSVALRGYFGLAVISDLKRIPPLLRLGGKGSQGGEEIIFEPDIHEKPEVAEGEEVYVFVVASKRDDPAEEEMACLVLKLVEESSVSTYRRVGYAESFYNQRFPRWEEYFSVKEVRLV
ncbi:hypothetical protein VTK56DRAFT_9533 [Thermocarpiscus australiensis]